MNHLLQFLFFDGLLDVSDSACNSNLKRIFGKVILFLTVEADFEDKVLIRKVENVWSFHAFVLNFLYFLICDISLQ